ncbi:MAG: NEW3 domain-containing protein, partial [Armatimonadota bacterium]|nr:NEW3 domain-containing protein [Armatimonadota bacterium]
MNIRLKLSPSIWYFVLVSVGVSALPAKAQTVRKVAEPFEADSWIVSDDSSATGSVRLAAEAPADIAASSKQSMEMEAVFSGGGFEFFKAVPRQPLVIPGATKSLSLWVRADGPNYGWNMLFKDGWGRSEANGRKLEWGISKGASGEWKKMTFTVPPDWVQPLTIDGILVHNWESKTTKASTRLWIDELQVETDISDVDPQTGQMRNWKPNPQPPKDAKDVNKAPVTPLLTVTLSATQPHNVFSGVQPEFVLHARNWKPDAAVGTLSWNLSDYRSNFVRDPHTFDPHSLNILKMGRQSIKVDDNLTVSLPMEAPRFGLYYLDSTLAWDGGKPVQSRQPFAVIPVAHELSDQEKDTSPYGLNVLSARQPMVGTFRKAGIIWYRDYGFDYEWMVRAKGADKSYSGWPWYPKIVKQYEASGVRVLANLKQAIKPPVAGKPPGPDLTWTREIVGMLLAFPYLRHFELDNEYDLNAEHRKLEESINWANYRSYHKKFGEIVHLLGGEQFVAVENGRAGIWPERVRQAVQSGDFAPIDVVNSHHYTGVEPPEINIINHNMGIESADNVLMFFDQLRAAKKSGSGDGKPRQHWLTEFGWDTKAGPVVSPVEQAAYLQRAYMMLAAAGTEKGFWFFDLDAPTASQFFDGCGLFTHDQLPKLSYVAYAGLTQLLPKPEYIGMINVGEGTWGYLFRNEDKLIAALWSVTGQKGARINFAPAKVYDFLANPLEKGEVSLGIEPVYVVGVSLNSEWFRQAAYSLETPYLVAVTAGDSVTTQLRVINRNATSIESRVRLQLPPGWKDVTGETTVRVDTGKTADVPLTFRVGTEEPLGEKTVQLEINESLRGEDDPPPDLKHTIPLRVQIQRPILMTVRGLQGEPGASDVTIRLANRSAQSLDGTLRFKLPASWSAATPEMKVALKPKESRDVQARVTWTPDWKAGESAVVEYRSDDGRAVQQPLIPSRLTVHHAPNLVMDGDLKEWPTQARLPAWVLGSTAGEANADVYLAWSEKGLHIGLEVRDSKVLTTDPRSFWLGDVLELFIDTRAKKTPRQFEPGDHQFWLVPQVDQKRVYVGQWKRGAEISETRYDVAGIQSAAVRRADGYALECLLPASVIQDFKPAPG